MYELMTESSTQLKICCASQRTRLPMIPLHQSGRLSLRQSPELAVQTDYRPIAL